MLQPFKKPTPVMSTMSDVCKHHEAVNLYNNNDNNNNNNNNNIVLEFPF